MKYFSMFSGIGGFELGIQNSENSRFKADREIELPQNMPSINESGVRRSEASCIGYSEIDKYAIQIYEKHFKGHKNYGDCTKINWSDIDNFDLLVGGFPCQTFSIAGKRGGFGDTRGTLFFEIARCLREKQPRLFLLENVKGLLSHNKGNTFLTILATLDELGYDLQWQVLNSKNFGVPQNRERVFIIGHSRNESRPEVFPIGGASSKTLRELTTGQSQGMRVYDDNGCSTAMASLAGGWGAKTGLYSLTQQGLNGILSKKGDNYASTQKENTIKTLPELWKEVGTEAFAEWGFGVLNSLQSSEILWKNMYGNSVRQQTSQEESEMDDSTLSRKKTEAERELRSLWEERCERRSSQKPRLAGQFVEELAEDLQELSQQNSSYPRIRRLTPLEAERLQGFPDGWTEGLSDTQRYKCLGNAVTVNVIEAIINKLNIF